MLGKDLGSRGTVVVSYTSQMANRGEGYHEVESCHEENQIYQREPVLLRACSCFVDENMCHAI